MALMNDEKMPVVPVKGHAEGGMGGNVVIKQMIMSEYQNTGP